METYNFYESKIILTFLGRARGVEERWEENRTEFWSILDCPYRK